MAFLLQNRRNKSYVADASINSSFESSSKLHHSFESRRSIGGGQMQQQLYRKSIMHQKEPLIYSLQQKSQSAISMADGKL
jgi:hypothetical protein